jgi:hypothetical protein
MEIKKLTKKQIELALCHTFVLINRIDHIYSIDWLDEFVLDGNGTYEMLVEVCTIKGRRMVLSR